MTLRSKILILVLLAAVTPSCSKLTGKKPAAHRKKAAATATLSSATAASAAGHEHGAPPSASGSPGGGHENHPDGSPASAEAPKKFALPFAWEHGDNEPLAHTRAFMREVLRDNRDYMKHGPKFFEAFAKAQKPRATVVTCADSRVQNAAWDLSPENDNFTIRNIGNQLSSSRGSVEYGIEHLNTAVLLIVGHTGCGAVKAAMGDKSHLSDSIRVEIDSIVVPKEFEGQSTDSAWTQAVIANVHQQVRDGLEHFSGLVQEGRLTVVGAVYDFRNDMGKGSGSLAIVDVNGNGETERLNAFVAAVTGTPLKRDGKAEAPPTAEAPLLAPSDLDTSVESITEKLGKLETPQRGRH